MGDRMFYLEDVDKKQFWSRYLIAALVGIIVMFSLIVHSDASASNIPVKTKQVLVTIAAVLFAVSFSGSLLIGYGFRQSRIIWSGTRSSGTEVEDIKTRPRLGGFLVGIQLGFVVAILYFIFCK